MNPTLHQEVTSRLLAEFNFKERGNWYREGKCPSCGKKELYTNAEHPWVIRCGRENNCAWSGHVKELYPELFNTWSDRFKASNENPHAAADAYLQHGRGFDLNVVKGLYEQAYYRDQERDIGSATVRFPLPSGGYWERLIDKPERFGKKKARFNYGGGYQGRWWSMPGRDLSAAGELWITEGIFDTLALIHHGIESVAALSCNNYPEQALAELAAACGSTRPTLIWALDADPAAQRFTRKWVRQAREQGWECEAAQIPQPDRGKRDWNDLHQRNELTEKTLKHTRYLGSLLIAKSASEKALLMYHHTERREFPFEYKKRLFWFALDMSKFTKECEALETSSDNLTPEEIREKALKNSGGISEIANCYPRALYYQANKVTDESWYYFRIEFPHHNLKVKNTFSGGQLSSASEFKKRLLGIGAGAVWTGSSGQLDKLIRDQLFAIKTVETVDYIGYSKEYGCWVFGDIAVKDGKVRELNEEDFFDLGKVSVKSLSRSLTLSISTTAEDYQTDWLQVLYEVHGTKGLIALAFWFGSLFAEHIRTRYKVFPFLEMIGEHGAGKTTLVKFLWKLMGRDNYEGFDPNKATNAGRTRNFVQVSALPIVLIEGDGDEDAKHKRFNWEDLKSVYNGNPIRSLGVKTAGNETYEPPFRGAIVIEQNLPVNASPAIMSRIVHMYFDRSTQNERTYELAKQLESWPMERVSQFILKATTREKQVMELLAERIPHYEREFHKNPKVKEFRIAQNHSLVMALVDALTLVTPITDAMRNECYAALIAMAEERQQSINADHQIVQEFWEAYEYLNGEDSAPRLNHSREDDVIAINLNHFVEQAEIHRQKLAPITELKRHLKTSRTRRFVGMRVVKSAVWTEGYAGGKSTRCWMFEKPQEGRKQ